MSNDDDGATASRYHLRMNDRLLFRRDGRVEVATINLGHGPILTEDEAAADCESLGRSDMADTVRRECRKQRRWQQQRRQMR